MLEIQGYKTELKEYILENRPLFEKLDGKTVLITGAAGLIGSYLADLILVSNYVLGIAARVMAVDRNEDRLKNYFPSGCSDKVVSYVLDVNEDEMPEVHADYVIHAASNTSPLDYSRRPVETVRTNVHGTDQVLQYCVRTGAERFLFCSSVEAYGRNNGDTDLFSEGYSGYVDCNSLRAGYPSAKRAAEALCNGYAAQYPGFGFVTARIGRIYGPAAIPEDTKATTQFILDAARGENIVLKSNGLQEYSYAYVGDCAVALLFILLLGKCGEVYNVADGERVLLKEFAAAAARAGGVGVSYEDQGNQGRAQAGYSDITKAVMDTAKIQGLGWKAKYPVDKGVQRTVGYIKVGALPLTKG